MSSVLRGLEPVAISGNTSELPHFLVWSIPHLTPKADVIFLRILVVRLVRVVDVISYGRI